MGFRVKTYILIGSTVYICFLGLYFYKNYQLANDSWKPSDIYNTIGDQSTTLSTAVKADKVFDAKLNVPMKSTSISRRKKPRRAKAVKMPSTSRPLYANTSRKYNITAVGEGLHTVSQATFRSFGAWGLMAAPQNQRMRQNKMQQNNNGQMMPSMYMMYPYPIGITPEENIQNIHMAGQGENNTPPQQIITPF